jgi:hypothetical protein
VRCAICGKPVSRNCFELHEVLVKRGAVPKDRQHLIFVKENQVPLHPACHMEKGQTREGDKLCLLALCDRFGAGAIGGWYVSLWKDHGLSVPRGSLGIDWLSYLAGVLGLSEEMMGETVLPGAEEAPLPEVLGSCRDTGGS